MNGCKSRTSCTANECCPVPDAVDFFPFFPPLQRRETGNAESNQQQERLKHSIPKSEGMVRRQTKVESAQLTLSKVHNCTTLMSFPAGQYSHSHVIFHLVTVMELRILVRVVKRGLPAY